MTPFQRSPLPGGGRKEWEWYVFESWNRLHAAREIDDTGEYEPGGYGVTECGVSGLLSVPGVFSRMGLPRCAHCCRARGIPRGDGTPYNSGVEEGEVA